MSLRTFCADLRFRFAGLVTDRWYDVRVYWYTANKGPWVLAGAVGLIAATLGFVLRAMSADEEDRRNLTCLAQNVYFEARGEPQAGQVAVAEVTMNRKASGRYPDTVCGVVYQKNWDPLRRRHVGAFSWTEFDSVETPTGEPWQQAWKVAESVYYRRETPVVAGALFYHATYIKPSWARGKQPIAQIGRHVFYR